LEAAVVADKVIHLHTLVAVEAEVKLLDVMLIFLLLHHFQQF
jgi:hypothetical protein